MIGGFFRTFNALGARLQVLFKRSKFGFVFHHAKVVAFKIVVRNVFHIRVVPPPEKWATSRCFLRETGDIHDKDLSRENRTLPALGRAS